MPTSSAANVRRRGSIGERCTRVPDATLRAPSRSPRALSRRLYRLNHHGWREKPRPTLSPAAGEAALGGLLCGTRRGAAFVALHAPRRTFEKRPFAVLCFSNPSRAVRGPFSNAATGSPFPPPPGIVSARFFDPGDPP